MQNQGRKKRLKHAMMLLDGNDIESGNNGDWSA